MSIGQWITFLVFNFNHFNLCFVRFTFFHKGNNILAPDIREYVDGIFARYPDEAVSVYICKYLLRELCVAVHTNKLRHSPTNIAHENEMPRNNFKNSSLDERNEHTDGRVKSIKLHLHPRSSALGTQSLPTATV